jgi:hypothetical protein
MCVQRTDDACNTARLVEKTSLVETSNSDGITAGRAKGADAQIANASLRCLDDGDRADVLTCLSGFVDEEIRVGLKKAAGAELHNAAAHPTLTTALINPSLSRAQRGRSAATASRVVRCVISFAIGTRPALIASITV